MTIKEQLSATADGLDALLTYANGVTGAADTNIGDAVKTLADGYGHGGETLPLTLEMIGRQTIELPEYTSTTVDDVVTTTINITSTDYAYLVITVTCDGEPESDNDWGGISVGIAGRYTSNRQTGASYVTFYKGSKSLKLSEQLNASIGNVTYGVYFPTNVPNVTFRRKCHTTACSKIMGGNYTVTAYGITSI